MILVNEAHHAAPILIIDDDPDLLQSLVVVIEALSDYSVITARNGEEGIERFYEHQPQCIIVDARMPKLDGFQFVRLVRGDPATSHIPLILLTALTQDKDRFTGLASGADCYLMKPVAPLELLDAIRDVLARTAAQRAQQLHDLAHAEPPPYDAESHEEMHP